MFSSSFDKLISQILANHLKLIYYLCWYLRLKGIIPCVRHAFVWSLFLSVSYWLWALSLPATSAARASAARRPLLLPNSLSAARTRRSASDLIPNGGAALSSRRIEWHRRSIFLQNTIKSPVYTGLIFLLCFYLFLKYTS